MNRSASLNLWSRPGLRAASSLLAVVITVSLAAGSAEPEIHRCIQQDGTISFQGTPCPEAVPAEADEAAPADGDGGDNIDGAVSDDFFDFVNPFDEPAETPQEPAPPTDESPALPSQDRIVCENTTRDAIDAIEVEMRAGYTEEEGQDYLAELLELTKQLRSCKEL